MAHHAPRLRPFGSVHADREPAMPPTRRSLFTATLAAIASIAVVLVGATPAHAEPSVTEIENQIDKAWAKLEPIIEKHNATRQDLAVKKKQADALGKKIQPLQRQVDEAMGKVSELAVQAYKGNNASTLNAILATGSPTSLMDQLGVLDQFARQQQHDIQAVVDLKNKYAAQKGPLDVLVAQLTRTEAELAAKKKEIDAEVARLQKLRLVAYGNGGGGVLRPAPCPATYPGGSIGQVVKFACAQIGKPYVWGAAGPNSYDCSGLTLRAWQQAGVTLPHNAARQRAMMPHVSRAELRPGDLVFYSNLAHVGIYVGNGWVVHAPTSGDKVRMRKVDGGVHSYGRPG
ncbi:C40 family peptidase [Micromonospora sp. NPDC003197]